MIGENVINIDNFSFYSYLNVIDVWAFKMASLIYPDLLSKDIKFIRKIKDWYVKKNVRNKTKVNRKSNENHKLWETAFPFWKKKWIKNKNLSFSSLRITFLIYMHLWSSHLSSHHARGGVTFQNNHDLADDEMSSRDLREGLM